MVLNVVVLEAGADLAPQKMKILKVWGATVHLRIRCGVATTNKVGLENVYVLVEFISFSFGSLLKK